MQEFEKAVLARSRSAKVAEDSEKDKGTDSEEDKDEDEDEAPRKRPVSPTISSHHHYDLQNTFQNNARKSITAFLQDQSDEE